MAQDFPDNLPDSEQFSSPNRSLDYESLMVVAREEDAKTNWTGIERVVFGPGGILSDSDVAKKMFLEGQGTALATEPPESEKAATEAASATTGALETAGAQIGAEQPAHPSLNEPAPDTAAQTSSGGANASGRNAAGADLGDAPRQATSLERTMSRIQMDGSRQDRIVMLGDHAVERHMYQMLSDEGKLRYQGGTPHISMSPEQIAKAYNRAAEELNSIAPNGEKPYATINAVKLELNRSSEGMFGDLGAAFKNFMGRQHTVTVLVGGDEAARAKGMAELNAMVDGMAKTGLLSQDSVAALKQEKGNDGVTYSVDASNGQVNLTSTTSMRVAVAYAGAPVWEREAYDRKVDELSRAAKIEKDAGNLNKEKAPEGGKQAVAVEEKVKVNHYAERFADNLNDAVNQPDKLKTLNDNKQTLAESILHQAHSLKDPASPELATLPTDKRIAALVQLEALTAKASDKEFGAKAQSALDKVTDKNPVSFKEKLSQLIAVERSQDPDFAAKADAIAKQLVASGFITDKQADALTSTKTPEALAQASTEAAKPPAQEATQATAGATTSAGQQETAAATQVAEKDLVALDSTAPLHARIEQAAKAGPDALSNDDVTALLKATREARATEDVTLLDPRGINNFATDDPTKTLVRLEAITDMAITGRYGAEAREEAGDVKLLLAKDGPWHEAEVNRYLDDPSGIRTPGDKWRAAEAERAQLVSWSGTEASTSASAAKEGSPAVTVQESSTAATRNQAEQASTAEVSNQTGSSLSHQAGVTVSAQDMKNTEKSVSQLSQLMANPAGSLTTRDHTWDPNGATKLAKAINGIDSEALKQMTGSSRAEVAAYAEWASRAAQQGKLPVSDGVKDALALKAAELAGDHRGAAPLDADATKNLAKAQRLEDAMDARSVGAGNVREVLGSQPDRDMSSIAKDLVHAVYKAPEMGEAYAKYTLKMASAITTDNIKSLSSDERARTAVALDFLSKQVKEGALGDFSSLSSAVQRHTNNSIDAADKLYQAYAKDPSMQAPMIRAENDLRNRDAAGTSKDASPQASESKQDAATQAVKNRELDR